MCWTLESSFYIFDFEGSLETEQLKSFFFKFGRTKETYFLFYPKDFRSAHTETLQKSPKKTAQKKVG